MPIWKRSSPEDKQRINQALQDAEASRRSLEAGGLPLQAQRRISEETQAGHPLFTSDLSTNEFSLVRNQGYTALSLVMGSSIYQVGWQFVRNYSWDTRSFELTTVSNAHQHAAQLALGRLEQEAALPITSLSQRPLRPGVLDVTTSRLLPRRDSHRLLLLLCFPGQSSHTTNATLVRRWLGQPGNYPIFAGTLHFAQFSHEPAFEHVAEAQRARRRRDACQLQ